MQVVNLRAFNWKVVCCWGAALALVLAALAWVMRSEADAVLHRGASAAGLRWAHFAGRTVPDLELAFQGRFTDGAREQLMRLRKADGVFRFKLYDREGNQILVSDDLNRPDLNNLRYTKGIGAEHNGGAKIHIRDQVLAGTPFIELERDPKPGRPAVYSEAYVPVLKDGKVLGVVEVYVDQAEQAATINSAFVSVAVAVAVLLSGMLAAMLYQLWMRLRKQLHAEERVRYMAHYDALSGLLNRNSFAEELQQTMWRRMQGGPGFALLYADLDRFKEVNDAHGHAGGDEVLRVTSRRLLEAVREGDTVARLGGDEFAILLPGITSVETVVPLAQRIVQAMAEPYTVNGQRVVCGGSVGIALHGIDGIDQADLMHKADLALYRSKASGRGTYSFYDSATDEMLIARRELTRDLGEAVDRDELLLHYQPLYESDTGELSGYEALLRWKHPKRGNVPPMEFIPLAEETGLIDKLGVWVLNRACADAAKWPQPLTVAINLSPAQFSRGDLVDLVRHALDDSGLEPRRLELEITESLLMKNTDQVLDKLRALSDLGISIAMDDFGTGYSSLAYLWRFPFDKVKIDRAFTQNLGQDPKVDLIVRSIITLAHSLNIRVNAEGVETPGQMTTLRTHGCDELQGFLLGRPGPLADLTHASHAGRHGFGAPQAAPLLQRPEQPAAVDAPAN